MSNLNELAILLLMGRPCLTRKDLAQRWGKSLRSIDRYKLDNKIPKPKEFFGPLWTPSQIIQFENSPAGKRFLKHEK